MKVVVELKVLVTVEAPAGSVDIDALRENVDSAISQRHRTLGLTDDADTTTTEKSVSFIRSKGG